jgi:predicted RNase H-like HicB family nuclease
MERSHRGNVVRYTYPVTLEARPDGGFTVSFPDLPETSAEGATKAAALRNAVDALAAALGACVERREPFPTPSRCWPGQPNVAVSVGRLRAERIAHNRRPPAQRPERDRR